MKNIWVTSDLHLGDKKISIRRGIPKHDEFIVTNLLSYINKNDTLIILGDYWLSKEALEYAKQIRSKCNHVILVLGNHDTDTKKRRKVLMEMIQKGYIDEFHSMYRLKNICFTHGALHKKSLKQINVHGHQHKKRCKKDRYYNVVPELNSYRPVLLDDIISQF